jgi:hypothetical protein
MSQDVFIPIISVRQLEFVQSHISAMITYFLADIPLLLRVQCQRGVRGFVRGIEVKRRWREVMLNSVPRIRIPSHG